MEEIVYQVGYLPELYEDAKSEKYKKSTVNVVTPAINPTDCSKIFERMRDFIKQ
jgi:hypothetical protein